METLKFDTAKKFAASLKTIEGFPWDADAVEAIAGDLIRWCKGGIVDRQLYSPEAQAFALVTRARETWNKWAGTNDFRMMFREMFEKEKLIPANAFREPGPKPQIECSVCRDQGTVETSGEFQYCFCRQGRLMQADMGDKWLARLNGSQKPRPPKRASSSSYEPSYVEAEAHFLEQQQQRAALLAKYKAVLADKDASSEDKEMAREGLRTYGPEGKKSKKKKKSRA